MNSHGAAAAIAVVIPCYRVTGHVVGIIEKIGPEVAAIYCVDDACPDKSGEFIKAEVQDQRVQVIHHEHNKGVGAATITGYRQAIADNADIIVKIDGDGQMDPGLLPLIVTPILEGRADYVKGNRFFNLRDARTMPRVRMIGNAILSFVTKLSSGYWSVLDPTNGYTAIHSAVAKNIVKCRIAERFFFESDFLYHLYMERAVVVDMPMQAVYGESESNIRIGRIILPFLAGNVRNFMRRIIIQYFLRDFSLATVELLFGAALLTFGVVFGAAEWIDSGVKGMPATAGTVMVAALPIIVGFQLFLSALNFDMQNQPNVPVHPLLSRVESKSRADD